MREMHGSKNISRVCKIKRQKKKKNAHFCKPPNARLSLHKVLTRIFSKRSSRSNIETVLEAKVAQGDTQYCNTSIIILLTCIPATTDF